MALLWVEGTGNKQGKEKSLIRVARVKTVKLSNVNGKNTYHV